MKTATAPKRLGTQVIYAFNTRRKGRNDEYMIFFSASLIDVLHCIEVMRGIDQNEQPAFYSHKRFIGVSPRYIRKAFLAALVLISKKASWE